MDEKITNLVACVSVFIIVMLIGLIVTIPTFEQQIYEYAKSKCDDGMLLLKDEAYYCKYPNGTEELIKIEML